MQRFKALLAAAAMTAGLGLTGGSASSYALQQYDEGTCDDLYACAAHCYQTSDNTDQLYACMEQCPKVTQVQCHWDPHPSVGTKWE